MVHFFRATPAQLDQHRKQIGMLWKGDALRHPAQLEEMRRGLILGQCQVWLAWDDDPPVHGLPWMSLRHCIGLVITFEQGNGIVIQFACGRSLSRWMPLAVERLEAFAEGRPLTIYVRKGWIQELPEEWKRAVTVTIHRDPELLRVFPEPSLSRA